MRISDWSSDVCSSDLIYQDEIGHVAIGKRWFDHLCARRGLAARDTWQALVRRHFKGQVKPPFNEPARQQAGLPTDFYAALHTGGGGASHVRCRSRRPAAGFRSEEHTSELQSLMRISSA